MQVTSNVRPPLITNGKSVHDITVDVCRHVEAKPNIRWMMAMGAALTALFIGGIAVYRLVFYGIGEWGLNKLSVGHGILPTSYGG